MENIDVVARGGRRPSRSRLVVGYAAVAATVPYLVLKILWLSGIAVGVNNLAVVEDGTMGVLNVFTAGMDVVAVVMAMAFTYHWGQRLPAWLVAFPLWVGTGFLAPIVVIAPVATLLTKATGGQVTSSEAIVKPWVYGMVYTGFTVEGLALLTAFGFYVVRRWRPLLSGRVGRALAGDRPVGAPGSVLMACATGGAVLAALAGCVHLAWGLGATVGLPPAEVAARSITSVWSNLALGALAIAAGAGLLMMVGRYGKGVAFWVPTVVTWTGAGSLFAWGGWSTVTTLSNSVIFGGWSGLTLPFVLDVGKALAGAAIGIVGSAVLARRSALLNRVAPPDGVDGSERAGLPERDSSPM